ncbi:MAG: DNA alkylation repair protein [Rhodoferax sp.]|nr:DNA alkylation repair protein [Rhodoferax sp.]
MTHPTTAALLTQIEGALRPLADGAQAVPMRAYMLDQFEFLGIRATPRREALRDLPRLKSWTASDLLALADRLWDLPEREFQYVAVDLLAKHHRQLGPDSLAHLQQLVQRKSWWDTVDGLAGVVGDIVLRALPGQPEVQRLMDAWLLHPNRWVRRVAMLHQLGWKAQTDEARLLHYALALASETEFFTRKAIGWALRDHARTRPQAVRAFLAQHAERLSGLTRREAGKHLG